MFNSVFSRIANSGAWRRATIELCELPLESGGTRDFTHRLLTVAGGLALVLSRCPKGDQKRQYPATLDLYRLIRAGLLRRGVCMPDPELVLESFHEVSGKLDPASRLAMRECLETLRDRERRKKLGTAPSAPVTADDRGQERATLSPSSFQVLEDL